jgi:hypothetical protein
VYPSQWSQARGNMREEYNSSLKRELKRIGIDITVHMVTMYLYYHLFLFPSFIVSSIPEWHAKTIELSWPKTAFH